MGISKSEDFYLNRLFPVTAVEKTADSQVKASAGTLYGFRIVFSGVTAGDKVEIRDSTTAGGGAVIFTVLAHTTDETHTLVLPNGMTFSTGIYHDETKAGGGTIFGSYCYK